jgi:hypothetical protein
MGEHLITETEDEFVRRTKEAFAALGFSGSFNELRCREIYRRTHKPFPERPAVLPTANVGEQLPLF